MSTISYAELVSKWGIQEITLNGPKEGNPFVEHWVRGTFTGRNETVTADGFYDGDGIYKVRFMPSFEGEYRFQVEADFLEKAVEGRFGVNEPEAGNHGPVRVVGTWHFAYEDGTPYYSIGTTCYVWELQDDNRIEETLQSLKAVSYTHLDVYKRQDFPERSALIFHTAVLRLSVLFVHPYPFLPF